MPTVTTTVTSAAASGATTTVTTTEATPEPAVAAPAAAAAPSSQWLLNDSSIYEVRSYYCPVEKFDELSAGKPGPRETSSDSADSYTKWLRVAFGDLLARELDVPWAYWRYPGKDPTAIAGPAYPGGLVKDAFEKAHPTAHVVVCWCVRFDDMAHVEATWGRVFGSEKFMAHIGTHPFVSDIIRMESRFMNAIVCKPRREAKGAKVYEVRNYTLDTSLAPWNEANRARYIDFTTASFCGADGKDAPGTAWGVTVANFMVAQAEPVTSTLNAADFQPIDHGIVAPHVMWTVEWDSIEQAEAYWAAVVGNDELMNKGGLAGAGDPFWPEDEPLRGYAKLESTWMTAAWNIEDSHAI